MSQEAGHGAGRLERRTRWLLRAYPEAYRADRGEEILGTLLEATPPGRGVPPARDVASVLAGGIRARAAANARQPARVSLPHIAMLGLACYTTWDAGLSLVSGIPGEPFYYLRITEHLVLLAHFLAALTSVSAMAAAWFGRRKIVLVLAAASVASSCWATFSASYWLARPWAVFEEMSQLMWAVVIAVAAVTLSRMPVRPPRSWLLLPGLPATVAVASLLYGVAGFPGNALSSSEEDLALLLIAVVMLAVAAIWLVTDLRPLAGATLAIAIYIADLPVWGSWGFLTVFAVAMTITGGLAWLVRRRPRIRLQAAG